jgi:hypothetical protein
VPSSAALARRVLDYIDSRPAELRSALGGYTGRAVRRSATGSPAALPYWLVAPRWLLRGRRAARGRRFLSDILFGQYCLFLAIRILDDLIDEQAKNPWLIPAGDDLLIESEQQFARHVASRKFWMLFRVLVRDTLHAIAEVDRLQRRPGGMHASDRQLYARGAAVFNAGVAAVCAACGPTTLYPLFARYAHHLAISGQLLDDLEDVEEDGRRGRLNVAATLLLRGRGKGIEPGGARWREALATAILLEGRATLVLDLAGDHANRAAAAARAMRLQPAIDYAEAVVARCASASASAHRARVGQLLGSVRQG